MNLGMGVDQGNSIRDYFGCQNAYPIYVNVRNDLLMNVLLLFIIIRIVSESNA